MRLSKDLSVGQLSERSGVPVSTLHFYESEGLIRGWRNAANHRRYDRLTLRYVAVIKVAQSVGLSLADIKRALATLPKDQKLSAREWSRMSRSWSDALEERIRLLRLLQTQLNHCIGCGCLSLAKCPLYNRQDHLAREGSGPRRWLRK